MEERGSDNKVLEDKINNEWNLYVYNPESPTASIISSASLDFGSPSQRSPNSDDDSHSIWNMHSSSTDSYGSSRCQEGVDFDRRPLIRSFIPNLIGQGQDAGSRVIDYAHGSITTTYQEYESGYQIPVVDEPQSLVLIPLPTPENQSEDSSPNTYQDQPRRWNQKSSQHYQPYMNYPVPKMFYLVPGNNHSCSGSLVMDYGHGLIAATQMKSVLVDQIPFPGGPQPQSQPQPLPVPTHSLEDQSKDSGVNNHQGQPRNLNQQHQTFKKCPNNAPLSSVSESKQNPAAAAVTFEQSESTSVSISVQEPASIDVAKEKVTEENLGPNPPPISKTNFKTTFASWLKYPYEDDEVDELPLIIGTRTGNSCWFSFTKKCGIDRLYDEILGSDSDGKTITMYMCIVGGCNVRAENKMKMEDHLYEKHLQCNENGDRNNIYYSKEIEDPKQGQKKLKVFHCNFRGCEKQGPRSTVTDHVRQEHLSKRRCCPHESCAVLFRYKSELVSHLQAKHMIKKQKKDDDD